MVHLNLSEIGVSLVKKVVEEICQENYPWILKDGNYIEVYECSNHIAFGGRYRDTYGWLEIRPVNIKATGFSSFVRSSKEFSDLRAACHFCIKVRFHFS